MKVANLLLKTVRLSKIAGKGLLLKLAAVTSRDRVFLVAATYYVGYANRAAFTSLEPKRIVFAVGGALFEADRTILMETQRIVAGDVTGVAVLTAFGAIVGAATTIALYFWAARYGIAKLNPNVGSLGQWGTPLLVYGLAVLAVSAIEGTPRIPFEGVIELLRHW